MIGQGLRFEKIGSRESSGGAAELKPEFSLLQPKSGNGELPMWLNARSHKAF
jgi:hypothetical protein